MLPQNFKDWTRDQWREFDLIKNKVFEQTPEEIKEQETQQRANMIAVTQKLLSPYSIKLTGEETDFRELYTEYISGTPDMKEWLGKDLQSKIDYYSSEKNSLRCFCSFVMQYE